MLSQYYSVEIGVADIQDAEIIMFNDGQGCTKRLYFLYDGTHYNLIKSINNDRQFAPLDEQAYQGVLELAKECKAKGDAIDPAVFSLVCY